MKRVCLIIVGAILISVSACGVNNTQKNYVAESSSQDEGDKVVEDLGDKNELEEIKSEMYSHQEIADAIALVEKKFWEWKGCTLLEIHYAGDEKSKVYQEWVERNEADEVMFLLSTFKVSENGGVDGSFNAGDIYDNFGWILVRNKGEQWKLVDYGY